MMDITRLVLFACVLASTGWCKVRQNIPIEGDFCPEEIDFKPCTCDMEGMSCFKAVSSDEVARAFTAPANRRDIRSLWIQGANITSLGPRIFGKYRFQNLYFDVGKIKHVDSTALEGMEDTLYFMSFFKNQLETFPFHIMRKFKYLQTANFMYNDISFIPDDSFNGSPVQKLFFSGNSIEKIGQGAFHDVRNLGVLDLGDNLLTSIDSQTFQMPSQNRMQILSLGNNRIKHLGRLFVFGGLPPQGIDLQGNQLVDMEEEAFKPILDAMLTIGDGVIAVSRNNFDCSGCEWKWLVDSKGIYESHILGFQCQDGRLLKDLTYENINCA